MAKAFRDLLVSETKNFHSLCEKWERVGLEETELTEDIRGEIRTTVGQAQLLIAERFKQFSSLIDNNEFSRGEKPTTFEDLQGFWDLIFIQVEDVQKKFKKLDKLQENNWVESETLTPVVVKHIKKKPKVLVHRAVKVVPRTNDQALAARKRLAEAKSLAARARGPAPQEKENIKTFDAPAFFSISSPVKQKSGKTLAEEPGTPKTKLFQKSLTPNSQRSLMSLSKVNQASRKILGEVNQSSLQLSL